MKKGCWALGSGLSGCRGAIHRACLRGDCGRDESRPYNVVRWSHGRSMLRPYNRNAGFSLVAVLFLIVVVAALGAFAVRIGASQQQTVNLALLGARALSAANAGIEYGAFQALNAGTCASATVTLAGALSAFTVEITCSHSIHADANVTNVYRINAIAYSGAYGQPDYVSRQVFATFMDQL